MSDYIIEPAIRADASWIVPLFRLESKTFGGAMSWYRYLANPGDHEHWDVIRPLAFLHWRLRKDGMRTAYELAVIPEARRQGLGRLLLDSIGKPLDLKTDYDNIPANSLYQKMGMQRIAKTRTRKGNKLLMLYHAE